MANPWAPVTAGAAAAATILVYCLAVDIGLLQILWNPLVIMLPLCLFLVAVTFIDGWGWPAALAFVSATFIIQTDLSAGPVAGSAMVCGAVWLVMAQMAKRRRRGDTDLDELERLGRPRLWWASAFGPALAGVLGAVAWLPPVIQQLTSSPGNIDQLVRFFRTRNPSPVGWGQAAGYAGRQLAVFPFRIQQLGTLTPASVHGRRGKVEFVIFVVLALALAVVGLVRRSRNATRFGIVSAVGALAALYSVVAIRGPVLWYLTSWMSVLAVPLLLGWLLLVAEVIPHLSRVVLGAALLVAAVAALIMSATTPVNDNRAFPNEPGYRANTLATWRLLAPVMAKYRGRTVLLSGDPALGATVAGVALKMVQAGIDVRVPESLVPPFGPEERPSDHSQPRVLISAGAPPRGYVVLGSAPSRVSGVPVALASVQGSP